MWIGRVDCRLGAPAWLAAALALSACASTGSGATIPAVQPVAESPPPPPPPVTPPAPPVAEKFSKPLDEINAFRACRQHAMRNEILLDTASRRLEQTVCGAALWFDGLFGERDLDAALASYGRVEISAAYSEFRGNDLRVRFDVKVKLPALEHRVSAFVGRDDQDDFARDRTEGHALRTRRRASDRDQFLTGLGFEILRTDSFQSSLKVGVRNFSQPTGFVQNRFSWIPYSNSQNRVLLRVTPFWNTHDHLGVTTSSDFDRIIEESFLLRWGNVATFSQTSPGLDWRTAAVLYQNLRGSSALAYEVFIRGATRAPEWVGEYGVRTVYRRPFFHESLFGELVLGYGWPRDDPAVPRKGSVEIGLGVEMPFGFAPT
jgi:hypothetical protein